MLTWCWPWVLNKLEGAKTQTRGSESRENSFRPVRDRPPRCSNQGLKPLFPGSKILVLGPISRILFAALLIRCDLHFSQAVRRRPVPLLRHLRDTQRDATNPGLSDGPPSPLFSLAPDWVFRAAVIAFGAVGSYPTFSPLPRGCPRGGIFSVTLSVKAP